MKYLGKPTATTFQQGQTVYVFYNGLPFEVSVEKTRSRGKLVSGTLTNSNTYKMYEIDKWFPESEVFTDKTSAESYMDGKIDDL